MTKPIFEHVVEKARSYVAARSTWTRFALALTGNNRDCEPTDAKAARFCAYGALVRSAYDLTGNKHRAAAIAARAAVRITGCASEAEAIADIYMINDGPPVSSRKEVLRMFDACLAHA